MFFPSVLFPIYFLRFEFAFLIGLLLWYVGPQWDLTVLQVKDEQWNMNLEEQYWVIETDNIAAK